MENELTEIFNQLDVEKKKKIDHQQFLKAVISITFFLFVFDEKGERKRNIWKRN